MKFTGLVVYGAYNGDKIVYVGMTGYLTGRICAHRASTSWGATARFAVMHRARSFEAAERAEKRLIRKHRPQFNIKDKPGGAIDGLLDRAEARRIWHSNLAAPDRDVLVRMTGWTRTRANRAFGRRGSDRWWHKPIVADGGYCIHAKLYRMVFHPETMQRD